MPRDVGKILCKQRAVASGAPLQAAIGAWATPGVRLLAKGKRLRGTWLDPFGRTAVRRRERELAAEYVGAIDRVLAVLTRETLDAAVALAELPDEVRGYEELKLERVARYRARLADALGAFRAVETPGTGAFGAASPFAPAAR
jgi:indolepyruvate ferredoxin oxidoreductase